MARHVVREGHRRPHLGLAPRDGPRPGAAGARREARAHRRVLRRRRRLEREVRGREEGRVGGRRAAGVRQVPRVLHARGGRRAHRAIPTRQDRVEARGRQQRPPLPRARPADPRLAEVARGLITARGLSRLLAREGRAAVGAAQPDRAHLKRTLHFKPAGSRYPLLGSSRRTPNVPLAASTTRSTTLTRAVWLVVFKGDSGVTTPCMPSLMEPSSATGANTSTRSGSIWASFTSGD